MDTITQERYREEVKTIKELFGAKKASTSYGEEFIKTQLLRCLPFTFDLLINLFNKYPAIIPTRSGIVIINGYLCVDLVARYKRGNYDDPNDEII